MTILQTKFYSIPVVIENITASAHITYYAHITPSYPTYPRKNDQKAHGWQFTAEVNYPFSCQFSQTEAHTHQSVSWDLKSVVHSLDVYDYTYIGSLYYVLWDIWRLGRRQSM